MSQRKQIFEALKSASDRIVTIDAYDPYGDSTEIGRLSSHVHILTQCLHTIVEILEATEPTQSLEP